MEKFIDSSISCEENQKKILDMLIENNHIDKDILNENISVWFAGLCTEGNVWSLPLKFHYDNIEKKSFIKDSKSVDIIIDNVYYINDPDNDNNKNKSVIRSLINVIYDGDIENNFEPGSLRIILTITVNDVKKVYEIFSESLKGVLENGRS